MTTLIGWECKCGNVLSLPILIARLVCFLMYCIYVGLDLHSFLFFLKVYSYWPGDHSKGETPDPMPNSEVKDFSVYGTAYAGEWIVARLVGIYCFLFQ